MGRGPKLLLALAALLALPALRVSGLVWSDASAVQASRPAPIEAPPAAPGSNLVPGRPTSLATLPLATTPATIAETPTVATVPPTTVPTTPAAAAGSPSSSTHVVVHSRAPGIDIYSDPAAARPSLHVSSTTEFGTPRALAAVEARGEWLEVLLPVRPNNATGWVRFDDVDVGVTTDEVRVNLAARTMEWFRAGQPVLSTPVAVGAPGSPTPGGSYYLTDIVPAGGAYGPVVLALNGHSDTYSDFGGSEARIALHGTNDPGSIGKAASHGCVRLPNDLIVAMARELRPGTPVFVA